MPIVHTWAQGVLQENGIRVEWGRSTIPYPKLLGADVFLYSKNFIKDIKYDIVKGKKSFMTLVNNKADFIQGDHYNGIL